MSGLAGRRELGIPALGWTVRSALIILAGGFLFWLIDQHVIFRSSTTVRLDDVRNGHPFLRVVDPVRVLGTTDAGAPILLQDSLTLELAPPRTFETAEFSFRFTAHGIGALALVAVGPVGQPSRAIVYWDDGSLALGADVTESPGTVTGVPGDTQTFSQQFTLQDVGNRAGEYHFTLHAPPNTTDSSFTIEDVAVTLRGAPLTPTRVWNALLH